MASQIDHDSALASQLFEHSYKELHAFLLSRVKDYHLAQDIAQEAYLRLMRVENHQLIEQPKAYLFRIALNLVFEVRMKEAREIKKADSTYDHSEDELVVRETPESELEARQAIAELDKVLDKLPALYKAVVLLRKRDGLSHQEIADKLEVSIHTVRKYLTRALVACRKEQVDLL